MRPYLLLMSSAASSMDLSDETSISKGVVVEVAEGKARAISSAAAWACASLRADRMIS